MNTRTGMVTVVMGTLVNRSLCSTVAQRHKKKHPSFRNSGNHKTMLFFYTKRPRFLVVIIFSFVSPSLFITPSSSRSLTRSCYIIQVGVHRAILLPQPYLHIKITGLHSQVWLKPNLSYLHTKLNKWELNETVNAEQ